MESNVLRNLDKETNESCPLSNLSRHVKCGLTDGNMPTVPFFPLCPVKFNAVSRFFHGLVGMYADDKIN